jgi:Protein of unknown function (DUF4239)
MNLYWLYDIPTWALFLLVVGSLCAVAVAGCLFLRDRFDKWLGLDEQSNEIVGHFLSFTGVFYGLVLGLVAVGAWETYNSADKYVQDESARMAALYRDVTQLPDPYKDRLQSAVRDYAKAVIVHEWPDQQAGIPPSSGDSPMTILAEQLFSVPVTSPNIQIVVAEAGGQLNNLIEARRARIQSATSSIPGSLWYVLITGTIIILIMTWLLRINSKKLDVVINILSGALMGTVLAFIVAMDNPYRGELSVSVDPYQLIYDRLMGGEKITP